MDRIVNCIAINTRTIETILVFFQNNSWIITMLILALAGSGIYRYYKERKQRHDEADIRNMFNKDGTKNMHYAHKDYDPFPCFVFAFLLLVVKLLLMNT